MPNFNSVALFVQKLFRWGNFTPPHLFNVHKRVNGYCKKKKKIPGTVFGSIRNIKVM